MSHRRWLLLITLALIGCVVGSLNSAEWIPNASLVTRTAVVACALSATLALRNTSRRMATFLLLAYGTLVPTLTLAQLWPPFILFGGWPTFAAFTERQLAQFAAAWADFGRIDTTTLPSQWLFSIGIWLIIAASCWGIILRRWCTSFALGVIFRTHP